MPPKTKIFQFGTAGTDIAPKFPSLWTSSKVPSLWTPQLSDLRMYVKKLVKHTVQRQSLPLLHLSVSSHHSQACRRRQILLRYTPATPDVEGYHMTIEFKYAPNEQDGGTRSQIERDPFFRIIPSFAAMATKNDEKRSRRNE